MAKKKNYVTPVMEEEEGEALGPYGMTYEDLGWGPEGEDADEVDDYDY